MRTPSTTVNIKYCSNIYCSSCNAGECGLCTPCREQRDKGDMVTCRNCDVWLPVYKAFVVPYNWIDTPLCEGCMRMFETHCQGCYRSFKFNEIYSNHSKIPKFVVEGERYCLECFKTRATLWGRKFSFQEAEDEPIWTYKRGNAVN